MTPCSLVEVPIYCRNLQVEGKTKWQANKTRCFLPVAFSTPKMEAIRSSETCVKCYQTTRYHNSRDSSLHSRRGGEPHMHLLSDSGNWFASSLVWSNPTLKEYKIKIFSHLLFIKSCNMLLASAIYVYWASYTCDKIPIVCVLQGRKADRFTARLSVPKVISRIHRRGGEVQRRWLCSQFHSICIVTC
jgi:hypothetical protein